MTCLQPQSLAISCQMVIDAHGCAYNLTNTVEALSQPWSKSSPKGPAVPVRLRHYREHLYLSSMCFSALLWTENQRLNQSIIIIFVIAILIIIAIVTVIVIVIIVTLWPDLACSPSIASILLLVIVTLIVILIVFVIVIAIAIAIATVIVIVIVITTATAIVIIIVILQTHLACLPSIASKVW